MGDHGGSAGSGDLKSVLKGLTAGGIAGAVSRTVVSPLERTKILFQVQLGTQYGSVWHALVKIGREEGVMGYLKGNGTNVIRIAPYSAVQFAAYEQYKAAFLSLTGNTRMDTPGRLLAGAMAGITSAASTYPLDLVRTRLSAQTDGKYKGIADAVRQVMRDEGGFFALYRGLGPTLFGVAPYVAVNFTVYETLRGWVASYSPGGQPSIVSKLACGGIAGAVGQTLTYPFDLVRRRMQVMGQRADYNYNGTFDAMVKIAKGEGVRGLFKGMVPNYLKVVPSVSVTFVTYEFVVKLLNDF